LTTGNFTIRVRLGEYEVELSGTRGEVLKTIQDLPVLMSKVDKAFEGVKPRKVATLTVKTEASRDEKSGSEKYPRITPTEKIEEAILRLLETDWGKWRPRTIDELRDALKFNGIECPPGSSTRVLMGLVKQERIRRWNTDAGYVYILAENEAFQSKR
jgi:hypothetical protein